jgi:riboflavin kinase/FMN adenylyltransferase
MAQMHAIGNFDGVHLGHQSVIERAQSLARDVGASCGILTFDPHPIRQYCDLPR